MKAWSVILIILALFIAIFPQFFDCESHGRSIVLEDGRTIPMKCHWSARAEIVVGANLLVTGFLLLLSKTKETRVSLGVLGLVSGISTMLLPTYLIGVCGMDDMVCKSTVQPALLLAGGLVIVVSLIIMIVSSRKTDIVAPVV